MPSLYSKQLESRQKLEMLRELGWGLDPFVWSPDWQFSAHSTSAWRLAAGPLATTSQLPAAPSQQLDSYKLVLC